MTQSNVSKSAYSVGMILTADEIIGLMPKKGLFSIETHFANGDVTHPRFQDGVKVKTQQNDTVDASTSGIVIEQPAGLMGKLVRKDCFKVVKVTP